MKSGSAFSESESEGVVGEVMRDSSSQDKSENNSSRTSNPGSVVRRIESRRRSASRGLVTFDQKQKLADPSSGSSHPSLQQIVTTFSSHSNGVRAWIQHLFRERGYVVSSNFETRFRSNEQRRKLSQLLVSLRRFPAKSQCENATLFASSTFDLVYCVNNSVFVPVCVVDCCFSFAHYTGPCGCRCGDPTHMYIGVYDLCLYADIVANSWIIENNRVGLSREQLWRSFLEHVRENKFILTRLSSACNLRLSLSTGSSLTCRIETHASTDSDVKVWGETIKLCITPYCCNVLYAHFRRSGTCFECSETKRRGRDAARKVVLKNKIRYTQLSALQTQRQIFQTAKRAPAVGFRRIKKETQKEIWRIRAKVRALGIELFKELRLDTLDKVKSNLNVPLQRNPDVRVSVVNWRMEDPTSEFEANHLYTSRMLFSADQASFRHPTEETIDSLLKFVRKTVSLLGIKSVGCLLDEIENSTTGSLPVSENFSLIYCNKFQGFFLKYVNGYDEFRFPVCPYENCEANMISNDYCKVHTPKRGQTQIAEATRRDAVGQEKGTKGSSTGRRDKNKYEYFKDGVKHSSDILAAIREVADNRGFSGDLKDLHENVVNSIRQRSYITDHIMVTVSSKQSRSLEILQRGEGSLEITTCACYGCIHIAKFRVGNHFACAHHNQETEELITPLSLQAVSRRYFKRAFEELMTMVNEPLGETCPVKMRLNLFAYLYVRGPIGYESEFNKSRIVLEINCFFQPFYKTNNTPNRYFFCPMCFTRSPAKTKTLVGCTDTELATTFCKLHSLAEFNLRDKLTKKYTFGLYPNLLPADFLEVYVVDSLRRSTRLSSRSSSRTRSETDTAFNDDHIKQFRKSTRRKRSPTPHPNRSKGNCRQEQEPTSSKKSRM